MLEAQTRGTEIWDEADFVNACDEKKAKAKGGVKRKADSKIQDVSDPDPKTGAGKKKAKTEPKAAPSSVDPEVVKKFPSISCATIHSDFDCMLNQFVSTKNENNFYKMQVLVLKLCHNSHTKQLLKMKIRTTSKR